MFARKLSGVALLACVSWAASAHADTVHLKDGREIEGKVTQTADAVVVETRFGTLRFAPDEVVRIERKATKEEIFAERFAAAKTAAACFELGLWAETNKLKQHAQRCMQRAVELEPDFVKAHEWLGHELYKGEWLTPRAAIARREADFEAEQAAKGLVQLDGRWVAREVRDNIERGLVLHEGHWLSPDELKRAQGLEPFEGDWYRPQEVKARRSLQLVERAVAAGLEVQAGTHALLAGNLTGEFLRDVVTRCDEFRAQFDAAFDVQPGLELYGGELPQLYVFDDGGAYPPAAEALLAMTGNFDTWSRAALEKTVGFWFIQPKGAAIARRDARPLEYVAAHCYHFWGHMLLNFVEFDGRMLPPWFDEGFACLTEQRLAAVNIILCMAPKPVNRTTTQGAFDIDPLLFMQGRWREILKDAISAERLPPFVRLAAREFGDLRRADLAHAMGLIEWLEAQGEGSLHRFLHFLRASAPDPPLRLYRKGGDRVERYEGAFQAAVKLDIGQADAAFRAWFLTK